MRTIKNGTARISRTRKQYTYIIILYARLTFKTWSPMVATAAVVALIRARKKIRGRTDNRNIIHHIII